MATLLHSLFPRKLHCDYGQMMQPAQPIRLAIYDMDKTITRRATFAPFLAYATRRHRPWRLAFSPLLGLTSLAYAARFIGRDRLKSVNLSLLLGRKLDPVKLERLSKGFANRTLALNTLQGALDRIETDRAAGYRIILATASYGFYAHEVGKLLGADDVIATVATFRDTHVSPRIEGENCYGAAKLRMVKAWMSREGIDRRAAHIRFYSDHVSDAPCLDWADEGIATNAHGPLRRLARKKGWAIKDWM